MKAHYPEFLAAVQSLAEKVGKVAAEPDFNEFKDVTVEGRAVHFRHADNEYEVVVETPDGRHHYVFAFHKGDAFGRRDVR